MTISSFSYGLIITHYSKFFKKNELEKITALAANSFMKIHYQNLRKKKGAVPEGRAPDWDGGVERG
ncbi:MAG: hypothetical protein A3I97_00190 [Candidatus Taylorbacteria bacterium RIFCSPLOWO2_02_FULL_44_35]|nr:MAG: hypothetical protein A3I97_00190 [Candidatus Taylorbacteria bacterium RIFCSPLOWO2_02_FULL_44_35]